MALTCDSGIDLWKYEKMWRSRTAVWLYEDKPAVMETTSAIEIP
jgi:hypothetical protein